MTIIQASQSKSPPTQLWLYDSLHLFNTLATITDSSTIVACNWTTVPVNRTTATGNHTTKCTPCWQKSVFNHSQTWPRRGVLLKDNRRNCCDCHNRATSKSLTISPAPSWVVTGPLVLDLHGALSKTVCRKLFVIYTITRVVKLGSSYFFNTNGCHFSMNGAIWFYSSLEILWSSLSVV